MDSKVIIGIVAICCEVVALGLTAPGAPGLWSERFKITGFGLFFLAIVIWMAGK